MGVKNCAGNSALNSLTNPADSEYNASPEHIVRYLILSDIHSNLEGLEACLQATKDQYEKVICLGDLVGYGPDPNAVITRVREISQIIIRGNHDKACCGLTDAAEFNPLAKIGTDWTRAQLTPEHLEFLRNLPVGPETVDWFTIVHGAPIDEDEYILGPGQALPALRQMEVQAVFFGHTHYQGGFMIAPNGRFQSIRCQFKEDAKPIPLKLEQGARYLINPGSAGQPRDSEWRVGCAVIDAEKREVQYYRTKYNLSETQKKMRAAGLPDALIRRLEIGR
jgi:predicted phosphodiesterase